VNINVLVEVAGIADLARDSDEVGQRLGDGFGGIERDETASDEGEKRSARGNQVLAVLLRLADFVVSSRNLVISALL